MTQEIQVLSPEMVDAKRKETLENESLRKEVNIRDINILDEETMTYKGKSVKMNSNAFKGLMRIIGMSRQFIRRFEQLFDPQTKTKFINTVKNAMSKDMSTITVILSSKGTRVVGFSKDPLSTVSNELFLNMTDRLLEDYDLNITNWGVDPTTGVVTVNAYNPNTEFEVMDGEVFKSGLTMSNSPFEGIQVMPYVDRMWCDNGLTTPMTQARTQDTYSLNDMSKDNVDKFFEHMHNLRKNNFKPQGFDQIVKSSANTPASLDEMEKAHKMIENYVGDKAEAWIPMADNELKYHQMGYQTNELLADQKRRAHTNQSIWSVVNSITHVARHAGNMLTNNIPQHEQTKLQISAGRLLGKNWDLGNDMPNPFSGLNNEEQVGVYLN